MKAILLLVIAAGVASAEPPHYLAAKHGGPYMHNYYLPPAPAATPWAPCWSPDGKWIAFSMQGSIWKVDTASGEAFELTAGRTYHSSPAWSPDGKWIVYTADDDTRGIQLEIVNLATGEQRPLTNDEQIYADPVFSPDGTRLAYVATGTTGYFKIYVRPIRDGQWAGEAILLTEDRRHVRERPYVGGWDMHTQPAWTPDGTRLVFVSNRNVGLGSGDLYSMPVEPGGMLKATRLSREQSYYRTRPHVSPDGKRIMYSSQAGGADQFNNIYWVPIDGGVPVKMTFGSFDHFHPRWSPDAERIAFISNEEGEPQLYVLETYGGARKKMTFPKRHWKRPMGRLRVRVIDAASGRPTYSRIHGLAADGKFYTPAVAYARITGTSRHCFFAEGDFTMDLPPGKITLTAVKGYEYAPAVATAVVPPGGTAEMTLRLERIVDLPARGWYSSSTHVHMNYGGNRHNTPDALARMAASEDLHIVNALIANTDNRFFDFQYFGHGREHKLEQPVPGVKITFGEEYRSQFYGHTYVAGLRDHVLLPYGTAYEGVALDAIYPTNADMMARAKAQGAVTGYVHPFGENDPLEGGLGAKAFPVDAALGVIDTLDWAAALRGQLRVWFRMLENDFRIAPTGGEDSIVDLHNRKLIGSIRTYAYLGKDFTVDAWYEALKQGRTYFSTGPLLEFRGNGEMPGGSIRLPAAGTVTLEGTVWSAGPLSKVTIYHRSGVLKELPAKPGPFRLDVPVANSDWFVLVADGPFYEPFDAEYQLAATNAIRVYVGDQKIRSRESAEYFMRWIDKLGRMTEQWPWWRSEAEKGHVFGQYQKARQVYERLAAEAR